MTTTTHHTHNQRALTVYKASAGSGKTFTLSVEYIKMLIANPLCYRNILAVTFTNKATEEMKSRILGQLYGIWKLLPDSESYIQKVSADTGMARQTLAARAGLALKSIVHNYSYFRIETIDSFFQSILRNLARELDLTANLRIELNDTQIEQLAVDEMLEGLGENDELLRWVMDYIMENIDEEKNWNVIGQIKKFGENIFREYYKTHSRQLNGVLLQPGFFKQFTSKLYQTKAYAEGQLKDAANAFFDCLERNGVQMADLKNKDKGPGGYFVKLRNGTFDNSIITKRVQSVIDNGGYADWAKDDAPAHIKTLAGEELSPMLCRTEELRKVCWRQYSSVDLTLRHMNQLRLLNSIEHKVREMNTEANRFLLSDTHTLLHSLISGSDTPFIFEKIGTQLDSIMIDEFQDTSTVQWENFKVLIEECLSRGDGNTLVVGDVKQSIYRWRSGDWRILNNIEGEFNTKVFPLDIKTLNTNYRSERRVIEFNDLFFEMAAEIEGAQLAGEPTADRQMKKAYADVRQAVPESKPERGFVSVSLLPSGGSNTQQDTLRATAEAVTALTDKGISQSDIAILVRSNSTIRMLANWFAQEMPSVKLVSDEAFRLDNALTTNVIVNALHLLTHPDDNVAKAFLAKAYHSRVLGNADGVNDIICNADGMDNALPREYTENRQELASTPLFDLAERIYRIFHLENIKNEEAYLNSFYDCLEDFMSGATADIDSFVKDWEENISKKTIQVNSVDGIRLISIHKSKGLEFDHVIIPFCDWRMEMPGTVWCSPTEEPFSALPLVPVDYSAKKMKGSIYEADYAFEHLQNCVDNLNLLYVAFTRASKSLAVIAQRGKQGTRSGIIEQVITDMRLEGAALEGDPADKKAALRFVYGEIDGPKVATKHVSDNIFSPEKKNIQVEYATYGNKAEFKQSNQSRTFVAADGEEESKRMAYINNGRVLHYIFSTIRTADDIDQSLKSIEMSGIMTVADNDMEDIRLMLHKRLETPQVAEWFSGKWRLFNECTILTEDKFTGEVKNFRPDRVMTDGTRYVVVDFKFGNEHDEHHDQVLGYMNLLRDMGHQLVEGYLWYVYPNKIVSVK